MKRALNLIALALLSAAGSWASNISIVLDNPNQIAGPGQTLNFFGTITNIDTTPGDAPIYLNLDSLNFTLDDATVTDNFFTNVPFFLAEGASSGDIDLFDITLANPEAEPLGVYTGTYGLLGGMDGGADTASNNLAQADFSVDVTSVTPEPATFLLVGVALVLVSRLRRLRGSLAERVAHR